MLNFSIKVVESVRDPLACQINEAVRISNCTSETQLNSKTEWHGPATVRLVAEGQDLQSDQNNLKRHAKMWNILLKSRKLRIPFPLF